MAPRSHDGAVDWDAPATGSIREGVIEFQPANQLYGPSAPASPRLKLLRIGLRATAQEQRALRQEINHCTRRRSTATNGMTTWSLPGRHLLTLDNDGGDTVELSASVDQSDIAE